MAPPSRASSAGGSVQIGLGFKFEPRDGTQKLTLRNARLQAAIEQDFPGEVLNVALRALQAVRERTPMREGPAMAGAPGRSAHSTGRAREGWRLRAVGKSTFGVRTFVIDNAIARTKDGRDKLMTLEYGSGRHEIKARRAKVLAFFAGGRWIFRRAVIHPGTQPFAMIRQTTADSEVAITALMRRLAVRAVQIWQGR